MTAPRIYLAIDNCFASKRWTRPGEWMRITRELGVNYVEASADNECDPLYADPGYLEDWIRDVQSASAQTGVKVANLYSGHGTYATLGLAHPDRRNQDRIQNQWLKVMITNAARLRAGLGFYCHAFDEATLQDPAAYAAAEEVLYSRLAESAKYAREQDLRFIAVEQMYSPHQVPWTIHGARGFLERVWARCGCPLLLTLDTGHQYGQKRFTRWPLAELGQSLKRARSAGEVEPGLWLGPASAYSLFREAAGAPEKEAEYFQALEQEMDRFPYLFSTPEDGDTYGWLRALGCYSPVVHLQQTDGNSSPHRPFTVKNNQSGIVDGKKVLEALGASYASDPDEALPPRCEHLYLTLEIFSGTADLPVDILNGLKQSVSYWRKYIPTDGLTLKELLEKLNGKPEPEGPPYSISK